MACRRITCGLPPDYRDVGFGRPARPGGVGGEGDDEGVADAVHVVDQIDLGLVQRGDVAHDGEPEAAPFGVGTEQAMEALEDAAALLHGDTRPVVADDELRTRLGAHVHRHAPAGDV